jgi:hypothetical protein
MNKIGGKVTSATSSVKEGENFLKELMEKEISTTEDNHKPVYNNSKNSSFRFLDLAFTIYYAITFVCFVLNFFGITHNNEEYFNTTWFVFALFIQLLATRLISMKEILFTKFPYEFHSTLRIVLVIQLLIQHGVFLILIKYPNLAEQIKPAKTQFLICNSLLILWSFTAIYKNLTKPKSKKDKK